MDASIIWDNPGLTLLGVLTAIFLVLLIPIFGAFRRSRGDSRHFSARAGRSSSDRYDNRRNRIRGAPGRHADLEFDRDEGYAERGRSRENRRNVAVRMRETGPDGDYDDYDEDDFDDDYDDDDHDDDDDIDDYDDDFDDDVRTDRDRRSTRHPVDVGRKDHERWRSRDEDLPAGIFGEGNRRAEPARARVLPKAIWFVIGVCVGAGGLALWWSLQAADSLTAVSAPFESSGAPEPGEPPPSDNEVQDRIDGPEPGIAAAPEAIGAGDLVGSFVASLKEQLPMTVGPGINMVNVDSEGTVVALGFTIAQTVAEEDAPKLQEELETRFRSSVCATAPDSTNIHGLNEQGVSFIITYVDMLGNKVAGLSVGPSYCSNPT